MKAGGRRREDAIYAEAQALAPPPGEQPTDELTGGDAIAAAHTALLSVITPAGQKVSVTSLRALRASGRVVVFVTLTDGGLVTLRIAEGRVRELRDQLSKVLGK